MSTTRVVWILCTCALAVLLLAACRTSSTKQSAGSASQTASPPSTAPAPAPSGKEYPIARSDRPYTDVHANVKQAWFLVETGYIVIRHQYMESGELMKSKNEAEKKKGGEMRAAVNDDVQKKIFGVNDKIEQLFKDAIKEQPDNPLNYAAYAYYLMPRKRFKSATSTVNTEAEAMTLMDQALKLWPDESCFYLLKVHIMTAPRQCNEWLRAGALEEVAISKRMPELRDLLAKAATYDPQNHFINYYTASIITKFTDPAKFSEVRDDVLREIRAGNQKPRGYFFFPPPLRPLYGEATNAILLENATEARYVDQWLLFGHYDVRVMDQIIMQLLPTMSWPKDKQDAGELMYMLYQIGRTKPYDRSLFSLQLKIVDYFMQKAEPGSKDSLKLAEASRFLNEQYRTVANQLYAVKVITDPTKTDLIGIQEQEMGRSRQNNLERMIQAPEAAYLKHAGESLGIKFPLPADPQEW